MLQAKRVLLPHFKCACYEAPKMVCMCKNMTQKTFAACICSDTTIKHYLYISGSKMNQSFMSFLTGFDPLCSKCSDAGWIQFINCIASHLPSKQLSSGISNFFNSELRKAFHFGLFCNSQCLPTPLTVKCSGLKFKTQLNRCNEAIILTCYFFLALVEHTTLLSNEFEGIFN